MLQLRARPRCCSTRFLSQSSNDGRLAMKTAATTSCNAEGAQKSASILSRLSDRTQPGIRRNSDTVEVAATVHRKPRPRATSLVSTRSARQRDHAAEKWFTDVQELDISHVNRSDNLKSPPRRKRIESAPPEQYEMRPRTDLNILFAPSSTRSAASSRIQTKKELGGDYTSYLPKRLADPHRLPVDYAHSVLGRNKHISLNAQVGALHIIEQAIRGRAARQVA